MVPPRTGGRIVVARVIAPIAPFAQVPTGPTSAAEPAPSMRDDADSGVVSDTSWRSIPALGASASRLSTPMGSSTSGAWTAGHIPQPAAASVQRAFGLPTSLPRAPDLSSLAPSTPNVSSLAPSAPDLSSLASRVPDLPSAEELRSRAADAVPEAADALRSTSDTLTQAGQALSSAVPAPGAAATAGPENVEQLVRKLYGPLVRRIKAELLLDRERRGIRIDGI